MNASFHTGLAPELFRLKVEHFLLLKRADAFSRYTKTELVGGELWGVPKQSDDEPESDASLLIKLRVADYEQLAEAGAFDAAGRTELVDGFVYRISPQFRPHGFAKDELAYRLRWALKAMGSTVRVATEQSVELSPHSEPQPDIILTSEPQGEGAIPGSSVRLIVEIAATTAAFDLGEKARIYAAAGVPEYWVVDLQAKVLHRHSHPAAAGYRERAQAALDEAVASVAIAGLAVETSGWCSARNVPQGLRSVSPELPELSGNPVTI